MANQPTALVIGAGVAGLASAIALRAAGYGVSIAERAPTLLQPGAAFSLWPNAIAALERLGIVGSIRRRGTPIRSLRVVGRDGVAITGTHDVGGSYLVRRNDLHAALLDAAAGIPLALGNAVVRVGQDARAVTARFADRTTATFDFVVAADGIWSDVANATLGTTARHRGYGGVVGISHPIDAAMRGEACEYWADGERFALFDAGEDRIYWIYLCNEHAPDEAASLGHAAVVALAARWPAAIGRAVRATAADRLEPFSVHARPAPTRLGQGRVLCVGDAAHAMEPNLGQGACQALEDAVALGVAARHAPPESIVGHVEKLRLARIQDLVRRSADGGLGAHARSPWARRLVRLGTRLVPVAIEERTIARRHAMPDYWEPRGFGA